MGITKIIAGSLAAFGLALALTGCSESSASTQPEEVTTASHTPAEATEAAALDPRDALGRSKDRWDAVVNGDWIQAYDYVAPDIKKLQSLAAFLQKKEYHEYKNPTTPQLVANEGDTAYIELSVLWTPHHPEIMQANNYQPIEDTIAMVETWRAFDGVWYWCDTARQNEFFEAHPELMKKQGAAASEDEGE